MKSRLLKCVAIFLVINLLTQVICPAVVYALTGGPSQPEVQSFQPAGVSDMVDPFTGDFSYNIPLVDIGGYPVNLGYNSNISMDQEASWCGLGWNVNLGSINRSVRGVADDFKGEQVTKTMNVRPNNTYGVSVGADLELFGIKGAKFGLGFGLGLSYNNYDSYGFEINASPSIVASDKSKGTMTVGLGLSASSESGVGITPSVSYTAKIEGKGKYEARSLTSSIGVPFNSRAGLQALTIRSTVSMPSTAWYALDEKASHNGGSQISFSTPTYTPSISLPMNSFSISTSATLGGELFGLHGNIELGGYFSQQALAEKTRSVPAFGYLYAHESEKYVRGNVMLDFNREKDGAISKSTPNMALANHTYDVYSVSGQGVGGSYRLFRGDVGTVYDTYTTTNGSSTQLPAFEIGGGNAAHIGTNFTFVNTNSHAGRWTRDNDSKNYFAFKPERSGDKLYETAYFKQAGEKSSDTDPELFERLGGFDPVRVELGNKNPGSAKAALVKNNNQKLTLTPDQSTRALRARRNQVIMPMSADEAATGGLETKIHSYAFGDFSMDSEGHYAGKTTIERKGEFRPGHHISEMSVTRPDGARYIYGIPTYNKVQKEVSFAVSRSAECASGLVQYDANEASTGNNSGKDGYFEEVKTPPFSTAYLLTAIVSPDYVDVTGNGPSDDDYGTYTKFNYSRHTENYQWRVPFDANRANYSDGLKSDSFDDKGNYLYGEKELWYVHSVETKTHVAEFYLSNREDGYGVAGEQGGMGAQTMQRLDSIALYSKPDRMKEKSGNFPGHVAEPIKKVHLAYDYSLCPGVPNNRSGQGKLTLREVYFTYQHSSKGKFSPYKFRYESDNPSYHLKAYDRWGNYKPNDQGGSCGTEDVTTSEFPYVQQNKALADRYSSSWHLTTVHLPSGGKIKVDFESDDYAYVQDRKAMQMFTIEGIGNDRDDSPISGRNLSGNTFLFFKLHGPIFGLSRAAASQQVQKDYLGDMIGKTMYFRFFIDLDGKNNYDYVPGYAQVVSAGVAPSSSGEYRYGYVELKRVAKEADKEEGNDVNPISKAAWQFARLQRPDIVFGDETKPGDGNIINIFKAMVSTGRQVLQVVSGLHNYMDSKGYGHSFIPHKSVMRLYNPTGVKFGGGSRVKRIAISDEWSALSNNVDAQTAQYGQEYSYTTTVGQGAEQKTISSGVAAYEPIMGGDENPFRQPISFTVGKLLAPDTKYYIEEPLGEMFFPGAQVGYSRVTVKNLQYTGVKRNATGHVVHEFYTAKDFPTIVSYTSLAANSFKPNFLISFLKVDVKELMTASQGYVVETNDMHGKQKAQWVYAEDKAEAISGIEYFYKKTRPQSNRLDNLVYTATKQAGTDGKMIRKQNVGIDYDIIADMREQENTSETSGLGGNLDTFLAAIFPVAIPVVLPKYAKEQTRFRSAVITKVIQRYGLVEKVVAHDLGSKVETKNLLYDAETGEVLLTETQNEFNDPIYSFTYPAHWGYEGMGMAYKNASAVVDLQSSTAGDALEPGDEVLVNGTRAWVIYADDSEIYLQDRDGNNVPVSGKAKVIRTGRRNQQTTPIGSVVSMQNPLQDANSDGIFDQLTFDNISVLNASAVLFAQSWKQPCDCTPATGSGGGEEPFAPTQVVSSTNPYILGESGNWRMSRSYTFLTERNQSRLNDNPDIRHDGTYRTFLPFWSPPPSPGRDWFNSHNAENRWTFTSEVTIYNTSGSELENRDALGRYSSALFGYNQTLPKSIGHNTMHKELGFDGFEDYDHSACGDQHFSFREHKGTVSENNAHSGKRSIMVAPNSSVEIRKKFGCPDNGGGGGEGDEVLRRYNKN